MVMNSNLFIVAGNPAGD